MAEPRAALLYLDLGAQLEVLALMTHPAHQGQGLMRTLGESFFAHFHAKNEIWLEVHAQNQSARRLYEIWGFVQVGERPHYYGTAQSAVLMTKTLPS